VTSADAASTPLASIKHIVVLMMENRSFDHMLGYLGLPGGVEGVNGLQNAQPNFDADGREYVPYAFGPGETAFHKANEPFDESLDPCHSPKRVEAQLSEYRGVKPGGFVKNFIEQKQPPEQWRRIPMGHYTAQFVPVYDFLARQFCVCDAWHSSVPGDTWPNRLYSLAGRESDRVHLELIESIAAFFTGKKPNLPIYEVEAFTRMLADEQWRWYSDDPPTLRGADKLYRSFHLRRDNFSLFDRKLVKEITKIVESPIVSSESFLDDAASNRLREVSWIDPNFVNLHILQPVSNDDHPPADILAGQEVVLELYDALTRTKDWTDTLLVVCYDEHGGFYDHVDPPPVTDGSKYATYGVRVPALVIGPRVKRTVSHQLFDHTSLIKTILLRFAADPRRALAQMPKRVQAAQDLGVLLEDGPRQDIEAHDELRATVDAWRNRARAERRASPDGGPSPAPDGAGHPLVLTEFQREFAAYVGAMQRKEARSKRRHRRSRATQTPTPAGDSTPSPQASA
jgi:phospholipase C